jgi:hypothetical protein
MMYQYGFISYNICTALVGNFDNGGGYAHKCIGKEILYKILYLQLNFAMNLPKK